MAILFGILWKCLTALLAIVVLRAGLVWFDKTDFRTGFKETYSAASPEARLDYNGKRLLALCLVVAAILF